MKRTLACLIAVLLLAGGVRADITSNLVAHWKLDETSGTSAADSSGNGHTGTYTNSPTLNQTGAFGSSKAVTFASASSQHVTSAFDFSSVSSALTVSCWLKSSGAWTNTPFFGTTLDSDRWSVNASGKVDIALGGFTTGTNRLVITSGELPTDTWGHVVVTWDGTTLSIYTNGVLRDSDSSMSLTISGSVYLARRQSGTPTYLDGTIDDVRIYSRALSADDVAELYAYTGARFPYWYFNSSGCDPFKVFRTRQPLAIVTTR